MPINFSLRFDLADVQTIAAGYSYADDKDVVARGEQTRRRGFLTRDDLVEMGNWKSARIRSRIQRNEGDVVEEVTRFALSARTERPRIEVLTTLIGVGWPMASVILHLCHEDRYPILDFRAAWSVGADQVPAWDFPFWKAYTAFCRKISSEAGVSMRMLDRALWQYSKDHQAAG